MLNKKRENIAINIEGNNVVVENKIIYFKLVSEPIFPLLLSEATIVILFTGKFRVSIKSIKIDRNPRSWEKASDHTPVVLEINH